MMSNLHNQKILPVLGMGNSILVESFHLLLRGLWGGNAPLELTLHALLQHDGVFSANQKIRNHESC